MQIKLWKNAVYLSKAIDLNIWLSSALLVSRMTWCSLQVRMDYQQLRRELVEVQALQRELSSKLRAQLRLVHGKFARLRQRIAAASPPR